MMLDLPALVGLEASRQARAQCGCIICCSSLVCSKPLWLMRRQHEWRSLTEAGRLTVGWIVNSAVTCGVIQIT